MFIRKRGSKRVYLVISVVLFLIALATPVHAGYFSEASLNISTSNYNNAFATYYSLLALWVYSQGGDGTYYAYQAYLYMKKAAQHAYDAWRQCKSGYELDKSQINYNALNTTYNMYTSESSAANYLWYIYHQDLNYIDDAILSGYSGGIYSSYAAYWVGLACDGGNR